MNFVHKNFRSKLFLTVVVFKIDLSRKYCFTLSAPSPPSLNEEEKPVNKAAAQWKQKPFFNTLEFGKRKFDPIDPQIGRRHFGLVSK